MKTNPTWSIDDVLTKLNTSCPYRSEQINTNRNFHHCSHINKSPGFKLCVQKKTCPIVIRNKFYVGPGQFDNDNVYIFKIKEQHNVS